MRSSRAAGAGAGALMVSGSMFLAQMGGAVAVKLNSQIGVAEFTWLRLVWAGLIIIVIARPWRHSFTRSALLTCIFLGVASAAITMLYMVSITRLPLGTATALQFLGPLTVSVVRSRGSAKWLAVIPAGGVLALTEPWRGGIDLTGVLLALGSGLFFALYILLAQRAGNEVAGLHALAVSFPVSAIVATLTVDFSAVSRISPDLLLAGLGVALLLPVIPCVLEFVALRQLTAAAFGTLLGLQPAVALVVGFAFLGQVPRVFPVVGIFLVVAASVGATLTGSRKENEEISSPVAKGRVPD